MSPTSGQLMWNEVISAQINFFYPFVQFYAASTQVLRLTFDLWISVVVMKSLDKHRLYLPLITQVPITGMWVCAHLGPSGVIGTTEDHRHRYSFFQETFV